MKVAVLDHGMGNLRSVARALQAAGASVTVTSDPGAIGSCDGLCVPGQGIFGRCMDNLAASGLDEHVTRWIDEGRPYLGICLGMQVLFAHSEEGNRPGLGVLEGEVTRLTGDVTIPHIGWNTVNDTYYYFDHSYAAHPGDPSVVSGWCEHGVRFAASIRRANVLGVQFHPEKSGADGIALLRDWVQAA